MQDDDYLALNDDDETLPTSAFQASHNTLAPTVSRDSDAQQVIEHSNNSANADTESITEEVVGISEDGLSRGREDADISDQEEGGEGTESDFDFVSEDAFEIDSDSEPDLSLDNDEMDTEDDLDDTTQSNSSVAKAFLEKTWSHLCDCEEENTEPGGELVFNLKQMAEYWQNLGVPDAIGLASLPPEAGEEESTHIEWSSVLSGGDQRPRLFMP
jgi:hypothetical protein